MAQGRDMNHLLCFGMGFSATALARRLKAKGWRITGTSRTAAGVAGLTGQGFDAVRLDGEAPFDPAWLDGVSHVVASAPPDADGDPVLRVAGAALIAHAASLRWVAYLSTTGVYGDRGGDWVDEESPLRPTTARGERRLAAERDWLALWRAHGLPAHLFRLAGIYGPGRNQLAAVLEGTARRVVKPGQVFSRIHVDDVAGVLEASIARPHPGRAYNVCDDEPAPPQDVVAWAARLLDRPVPPEIAFDGAELSPMAKSFYAESKRVANARIKDELGYRLTYPNYRQGLAALLADLPRR
jgi:nucleoside-diphosphate-sugar epimerase